MVWELVDFKGLRGKAKVSIRKNGQIGFNGTFAKQYRLSENENKYVKLFYDRDNNKIGLMFSKENQDKKYINIIFKEGNIYVPASVLFYQYSLDPKYCSIESFFFNEESGMVVLDILKK